MDEVWYRAPDWTTTNPLALVLYGLAGGVVVALVLARLHQWSKAKATTETEIVHPDQLSIDVINFSHLQVVGAGGLGLVVVCAMVAIVIPPVGFSLLAGCVSGTAWAILSIVRQRKDGPISSSSRSPGANTTLRLDEPSNGDEPVSPEVRRVRQLSATELKRLVDDGVPFELVDVRTDEERSVARIDGSRLLDRAYHDELLHRDKNTLLVFQCHHGIRSQQAAEHFRAQGFTNLCNLEGGIDAWSVMVDPRVPRY